MAQQRSVILSAIADEAAIHKTAIEQFAVLSALGLQYYSIRTIDVGKGVKNVMRLTKWELSKIRNFADEYGMNVASLASPIGKVKFCDVRDGTKNVYIPFKKYLHRK